VISSVYWFPKSCTSKLLHALMTFIPNNPGMDSFLFRVQLSTEYLHNQNTSIWQILTHSIHIHFIKMNIVMPLDLLNFVLVHQCVSLRIL
jgi:hypothetical protein